MTTETMEGWRESRDPAELAAAVADGVEVQVERPGKGWESTGTRTVHGFRIAIGSGLRYRAPADWQREPEATGAERYLAERMEDPDYAAAHAEFRGVLRDADLRERVAKAIHDNNEPPCKWVTCDAQREFRGEADAVLAELAPELAHVPPDGYEAVYLPPEMVDGYAEALYVDERLSDGCRATQARRPKPEPETERVPWWAAVGRVSSGMAEPVDKVTHHGGSKITFQVAGHTIRVWPLADGTVEVLKEAR